MKLIYKMSFSMQTYYVAGGGGILNLELFCIWINNGSLSVSNRKGGGIYDFVDF
jgi:hypothetical protein